jgi:MFS family permease
MTTGAGDEGLRPTTLLPMSSLLRLSGYWLGLVAVFAGINVILQERIKVLQPDVEIQYTTLGFIQIAGVLIAVLVQPTVGTISDYTISRFGRRKPYILIGTVLDAVFLVGIATSNTVLAVAAFMVLLQFSSNFAQGPFQGYVPDLVPERQVGLASGMVGLFNILGILVGTVVATIGIALGDFLIPTVALGVIELATMLSLFFRLDEGRKARDRAGRSWGSVAREAWGTDILQER